MSPRPNHWVNGCNQQNISPVARWHFSQSACWRKVPPQPNSLNLSDENRATSIRFSWTQSFIYGEKNRNVFCHKVLQGLNRLFELRVNEAGGHSVFTSWRFSRFSAWFLYLFYNIWSFYFCCIRPSTQHQEIKHTNQCAAHLLLLSTVCCSVLREAVLWRRPLSSCCPLLTFTDLWPQTTNKRFPQRHCRSPDWSDSW